jgi:TPR repeat protein
MMYAQGIGVMRQDAKAELWLRRAASGGHELAQRGLEELIRRRVENLGNYPLPDLRRVRGSLFG